MTSAPPRLALVAGEASGDLLAGMLLQALQARWPGLASAGIGGPRMQEQGFDAWWPSQKLAVHGYAEALRAYRELSGIRRQLAERIKHERPDLFIGVDAPDFNLGLERWMKEDGIKTVHFVSPSVWAWRGGRIRKIAAAVDHMLCLFPFEPALYAEHGVAATYVGHPLADAIPLEPPRPAARAALGLADGDEVVALLPGSRGGEATHIAPVFLQAAALMRRSRPALRFVLPMAPGLEDRLRAMVAEHAPDAGIQLVAGRSHEVLAACDVTLIASGTATLEAALFKRPMVIAYRMNALSWQIMRRMRYQPWIGLPNILARDFLVPELLQQDATPERLAHETLAWLDDPARMARVQARFLDIHHTLRQDTAQRAGDAIAQVLGR
ncbi:MAG: lipid-A-disaccharide synthase [Burkholderiales bacterium]|nr:lipid-A-disaccharide synthase [Burkholderiales bacterium]